MNDIIKKLKETLKDYNLKLLAVGEDHYYVTVCNKDEQPGDWNIFNLAVSKDYKTVESFSPYDPFDNKAKEYREITEDESKFFSLI